jgi:hypothetical protein
MPVQLNSIRVEAALDASQYVEGARQKAAADQQMVEGANKLGASLDQTDRRLGQSATVVERLARSIDPAYAAETKLAAGAATLQRALDAGTISGERTRAASGIAANAIRRCWGRQMITPRYRWLEALRDIAAIVTFVFWLSRSPPNPLRSLRSAQSSKSIIGGIRPRMKRPSTGALRRFRPHPDADGPPRGRPAPARTHRPSAAVAPRG